MRDRNITSMPDEERAVEIERRTAPVKGKLERIDKEMKEYKKASAYRDSALYKYLFSSKLDDISTM